MGDIAYSFFSCVFSILEYQKTQTDKSQTDSYNHALCLIRLKKENSFYCSPDKNFLIYFMTKLPASTVKLHIIE